MNFQVILSHLAEYTLLAVVFLLMISALVAAHELGHYLFARLFGMGVEEFAIGFGKKPIWTWMRRNYEVQTPEGKETETTDFTVRPWPLGGFVRIKGMQPEDDGSETKVAGGFYSKPPWQRFIVLLAGPAFSVIFGILIMTAVYTSIGIEKPDNSPVFMSLSKEGPAYQAGARLEDRIVSLNGEPVTTLYDYVAYVRDRADQKIVAKLDRAGKEVTVTIVPKLSDDTTPVFGPGLEPTGTLRRQALTGVGMVRMDERIRLPLGTALITASTEPVRAVRGLVDLATHPRNFDKAVSGPITMVKITEAVLKQGFVYVLTLSALLSISIGIMNLLPIGMLDGGQMVIAVVEMLRGGKRLSIRSQEAYGGLGFIAMILLMSSVMFIDVKRWFFTPEPTPPKVESKQD